MFALRYVALLALVIWVGGLLALGAIAAPSIFAVLAVSQPDEGRTLAGALFGEILHRFHMVSYAAGALLLGTLLLRRVLGPGPRRFAWRAGIATVMLAASAYSGLVVASRIAQIQGAIGAAPSSLPAGDARLLFDGWELIHAISPDLTLYGIALAYTEHHIPHGS